MLKIEDVKAGDDVECIDIAEFSKIWGESQGYGINKMEDISLLEIGPYYFRLKGKFLIGNMGFDEIRPSLDCLKYFKKKEQSQYTFDDLIDVAVQAYKDGVLSAVDIESEEITIYGKNFQSSICDDSANEGIKHIQSLYKETFVIECEDDIERINDEYGRITLSNGEIIPKQAVNKIKELNNSRILFMVLKGATVEQERGRDDRS